MRETKKCLSKIISSLFRVKELLLASNIVLVSMFLLDSTRPAYADDSTPTDPTQPVSDNTLREQDTSIGFIAAIPIERKPPRYPLSRRVKIQAGMVEVEYMVNTDGKVYEPMVIDSSHSDFEEAALSAVSEYRFEPATLNGVTVDSANRIRIRFEVDDQQDAADAYFAKLHKSAKKSLLSDKPNKKKIRRNLDTMANTNFLSSYSLAFLFLLETQYANKFLNEEDQLNALRKVLLFEDGAGNGKKIFDDTVISSIKANILNLQIRTGQYGKAWREYDKLKKEWPEIAKKFEGVMQKVDHALSSDQTIVSNINLGERGHELVLVSKRKFVLDQIKGEIHSLKFRCDRIFREMEFKPVYFTVPDSWGNCMVQIIGTPNTTAKFLQE